MKKTNYTLPTSVRLIFRKAFVKTSSINEGEAVVTEVTFNQYCLAVYLHVWLLFDQLLPDISKSSPDEREAVSETLKGITDYLGLTQKQESDYILLELPSDPLPPINSEMYMITHERLPDFERLIYYYFWYFVLRKKYTQSIDATDYYHSVVEKFELLRAKFKIPLRLEYNKFRLRGGIAVGNGIVVSVPEVRIQSEQE